MGLELKIINNWQLDLEKIHQDLGFSCLYAHLNDSPSKTPIYAKLTNNDKINLVLKVDEETGHKQNIAQIRWLTYVNTESAKRSLAKYFENKGEKVGYSFEGAQYFSNTKA